MLARFDPPTEIKLRPAKSVLSRAELLPDRATSVGFVFSRLVEPNYLAGRIEIRVLLLSNP